MVAGRKAGFHQKEHIWQSGSKNGKLETQTPAAQPSIQSPTCPSCQSNRAWKDGLRITRHGEVQRYICRECGFRFSETTSEASEHLQRIDTKSLKRLHAILYNRQVCVTETKGAKNLVEVESRTEKWAAGATTTKLTEAEVKGKIIEFLWYLKRNGYALSTVKTYVGALETLQRRGAGLIDPESVKLVIAEHTKWSNGRKANVIKAYGLFLRMLGLKWEKPLCNVKKGLPRPPTPEQVKQLVAGASRKYAPIFRFMAETGASPVEVSIMSERNFDFERNTVYIEGRKKHLDRVVPLSNELVALMKTYLARYGGFPKNDMIGRKFRHYRNRLASKLNDQAIRNVRLYDLRHYFGTMTYARTKDPIYVKDLMGHTKLETTMVYTKLVAFPEEEEYICRAAKTMDEATELIEAGFEKHDEFNGVHLYRKRKALLKGAWSSQKGPWSSLV